MIAEITSLRQVFDQELKEIFNAEEQLIEALGSMAENSASLTLQKAFKDHLSETREQLARLRQLGSDLDIDLNAKESRAMRGLISSVSEIIELNIEDRALKDILLIAAAQKIEHYEISSYGTLCALAQNLELSAAIEVLQDSLDEESVIDDRLSEIAEDEIFGSLNGGRHQPGIGKQHQTPAASGWRDEIASNSRNR